jgi:Na+/H+-translocating membrane pyrophosphatase
VLTGNRVRVKTSVRAEQAQAPALASARKASWPEGATAGILLVAAACLAVSLTLYHVAGPRDVFAQTADQDVGMQAIPSPSGSSSFR